MSGLSSAWTSIFDIRLLSFTGAGAIILLAILLSAVVLSVGLVVRNAALRRSREAAIDLAQRVLSYDTRRPYPRDLHVPDRQSGIAPTRATADRDQPSKLAVALARIDETFV